MILLDICFIQSFWNSLGKLFVSTKDIVLALIVNSPRCRAGNAASALPDWAACLQLEASEELFRVFVSSNNQGVFAFKINRIKEFWNQAITRNIAGGLLFALALSGIASAQQKKDEITFELIPNPAVIDCLRANSYEEPRAKATVIRGQLNDTLILDLDGIKPGLGFDLFEGSFGLAWYQSDVEVGKRTDDGHVRIKTILLDQIFGFDPDVKLPPTNTFHLGFWFNNPEDAAALPTCHFDPKKPTPFNGEHKAGPFAMISGSNPTTKLGPLCTDPNDSTKPASCNP